jgi:hypothetical protein
MITTISHRILREFEEYIEGEKMGSGHGEGSTIKDLC